MSAGDLGSRLAVVPMSQEARGLDAGQRLAERLVGAGDNRSAAIVGCIAEEERAHVAVGVSWFVWLCQLLGQEPGEQFRSQLAQLCPDLLKGPFNHPERELVGLQRQWYDTSLWDESSREQAVQKSKGIAAQQTQQAAAQLRERLESLVAMELGVSSGAA